MKKPAELLDEDANEAEPAGSEPVKAVSQMERFPLLKKVALCLAASAVIFIAALAVLPVALPQSMTKGYAENIVSRILGTKMVISGEHSLQVLPSLVISANDLESDPQRLGDVLVIDEMMVELNAISALAGHLNVQNAKFVGPKVDLGSLMVAQYMNEQGAGIDSAWGWWRDMTISGLTVSDGKVSLDGGVFADALEFDAVSISSVPPLEDEATDGSSFAGKAVLNGQNVEFRLSSSDLQLLVSGNRWPFKFELTSDFLRLGTTGSLALRERLMGEGEFSVTGQDTAQLNQWLGTSVPSRGGNTLSVSGKFEKSGAGYEFTGIETTVGGTIGQGSLSIAGGAHGVPEILGRFSASTIDFGENPLDLDWLDRVLRRPAMPSGVIDVEWANARFGSISMGAGGLRLDRPAGATRITATLRKTSAGDGAIRGAVTLDLSEGMGALRLDGSITDFNISRLRQGLAENSFLLSDGILTMDVSLFSVGGSLHELTEALTGNAKLIAVQGALNIPEDEAAVQGLDGGRISFASLNGAFNVAQGIAVSNDILVKGDGFNMVGNGQLDLADWTIDLVIGKTSTGSSDDTPMQFNLSGPADAVEVRAIN